MRVYKPVLSKQARSQALLNQRAYKAEFRREVANVILGAIVFWESSVLILLLIRCARAGVTL